MEDILPGYNEAKESLLAKLHEPIEMYILTKLKLDEFRKGKRHPTIEGELKENLLIHARQIDEILFQDIDNQ